MKHVVIATKNEKKKKELKKLLSGLGVRILCLADLKMHLPRVIEDGKTFRQNAIKKALTFSRYIEGLILADDSGLAVNALGGKPGVRSARFAHTKATDRENNAKLLRLMEKIPAKERQAIFVCSVALAEGGNLVGTCEAYCSGTVGFNSKGRNGFGYDPLFTPKGYSKTFAEISPLVKNKISHRGKALKKAKEIILECL